MKTALLHEDDDLRTFVLVLGSGDETMSALASFAADRFTSCVSTLLADGSRRYRRTE
jgi:hypothetical protein